MMCVFDVLIIDTDAESYDRRNPHKILYQYENKKKEKYLKACLEI